MRSWDYWVPDWFDLRVWDGQRLIVHVSYDTPPDRREYRISDRLTGMAASSLGYFSGGFQAGPHQFWWDHRPEDHAATARLMGKPEDYSYGGQEMFHGTECHVVSRWANWTTFYIAVADGRLRGGKDGAQKMPEKRLLHWLNLKGHTFRNPEELRAWIKSRTPQEASRPRARGIGGSAAAGGPLLGVPALGLPRGRTGLLAADDAGQGHVLPG